MFATLIDDARRHDTRFTVYAAGEETGVDDRFGDTGIEIDHQRLPPHGPDPFVTIHDGGQFAGTLSLADFEELLAPPIVRPGDCNAVSAGYRALFDVLDDTVFSTLDRRQLLGASREIEDRAFRVGHGVLRVSFQRCSAFEPQQEVYRQLAGRAGLEIHVYGGVESATSGAAADGSVGEPDWEPPAIDGLTYHVSTAPALDRYWALAFDGGINERQACALVAREQAGGYTGFWTYDPETVGVVLDELAALDG